MILVDTSVLINFFKGKQNKQVEKLEEVINNKVPFGICDFVYMEILQGARTEKEFNTLKDYLSTQKFYELQEGIASYEKASRIFFNCRRQGITIRSIVDVLISQIAIENGVYLLHDDNDFNEIAKVEKNLKEF